MEEDRPRRSAASQDGERERSVVLSTIAPAIVQCEASS